MHPTQGFFGLKIEIVSPAESWVEKWALSSSLLLAFVFVPRPREPSRPYPIWKGPWFSASKTRSPFSPFPDLRRVSTLFAMRLIFHISFRTKKHAVFEFQMCVWHGFLVQILRQIKIRNWTCQKKSCCHGIIPRKNRYFQRESSCSLRDRRFPVIMRQIFSGKKKEEREEEKVEEEDLIGRQE